MRFTVLWGRDAEDGLAAIWTSEVDRNAITAAAYAIDNSLADDPTEQGESRSGKRRITFFSPLGVDFEVLREEGVVRVLRVWVFKRGKRA